MAEHFIAEGLHYRVAGRAVIDDVSLALEKGELVALIGPNGAGKSTLLRLLTGFLKPATGRCVLAGKPLDEWHSQTLSRHRAVMRQQTQLNLRVVHRQKDASLARRERRLDGTPQLRARRNVLQIRVARRQTPRRGDGLVVRGVHTTVTAAQRAQRVQIG